MKELQRLRHEAVIAGWDMLRPLPLPNDFATTADAAPGLAAPAGRAAAASDLTESRAEAASRLRSQHAQPSRSTAASAAAKAKAAAAAASSGAASNETGVGAAHEARHRLGYTRRESAMCDGSVGGAAAASERKQAKASASAQRSGEGSPLPVAVAVRQARLEERRRMVSLSRSFRALLAASSKKASGTVPAAAVSGLTRPAAPPWSRDAARDAARGGSRDMFMEAFQDGAALRIQTIQRRKQAARRVEARRAANQLVNSVSQLAGPRGRTTSRRVVRAHGVFSSADSAAGAGAMPALASTGAAGGGGGYGGGGYGGHGGGMGGGGVSAEEVEAVERERASDREAVADSQRRVVARQAAGASEIQARQRARTLQLGEARAAARHGKASVLQSSWRGRSERQLAADWRVIQAAGRAAEHAGESPSGGDPGGPSAELEALRSLPAQRVLKVPATYI